MDINIQIIENVKKFPQLYQKNSDVTQRQRIWEMLANSMKLDEQFLKSRWYILREHYTKGLQCNGMQQGQNTYQHQPRSMFKYNCQMEFIKKYISTPSVKCDRDNVEIPHNWIKPEFIITEADLQWKPENDAEAEEIFFLSAEDEEHNEEQRVKQNIEEDDQEEDEEEGTCQEEGAGGGEEVEQSIVIEEEIPFETTAAMESGQVSTTIQAADHQEINNESAKEAALTESDSTILQQESENKASTEEIEIKQETTPDAVDYMKIKLMESHSTDNEANQTYEGENVPSVNTKVGATNNENQERKLQKTQNSRCEDAIFGELVAAMLKTIEPNKKKAIKKEIMNLLLS